MVYRPKKKSKNPMGLTKLFRGFRVGFRKPFRLTKVDIQRLEKQEKVSYFDNMLVQTFRDKCKDNNSSETHRARLDAILAKEVFEAEVDSKGNPWSRPQPKEPEPVTEEAVEEAVIIDEENK